jgi:hypothetical protein
MTAGRWCMVHSKDVRMHTHTRGMPLNVLLVVVVTGRGWRRCRQQWNRSSYPAFERDRPIEWYSLLKACVAWERFIGGEERHQQHQHQGFEGLHHDLLLHDC